MSFSGEIVEIKRLPRTKNTKIRVNESEFFADKRLFLNSEATKGDEGEGEEESYETADYKDGGKDKLKKKSDFTVD